MPLRYVKKRLTAENALSVAIATTAVTRELADMTQFPPARAAAGLLLLIFQTIQVSIITIMCMVSRATCILTFSCGL